MQVDFLVVLSIVLDILPAFHAPFSPYSYAAYSTSSHAGALASGMVMVRAFRRSFSSQIRLYFKKKNKQKKKNKRRLLTVFT